jgi:hypothetical protein
MNFLSRVLQSIVLFASIASAQVMNDAKILSQGNVNIGIAPVSVNSSFGLYTDLGYGITRGMDLDVIVGFLQGGTYVGANLEFPLGYNPNMSVAIGGHTLGGTAGIDGTFNISFPITGNVGMYLGADADLDFNSGNTFLPVWAFAAVNVRIRSNVELFIEVDPAISNDASNIFAGGLKIYF